MNAVQLCNLNLTHIVSVLTRILQNEQNLTTAQWEEVFRQSLTGCCLIFHHSIQISQKTVTEALSAIAVLSAHAFSSVVWCDPTYPLMPV